jgi:NADPH2:quinone reductase
MKAITFEQFGGASVLRTTTVATPTAKAGEVLIRLTHTSVNPVDWKIREGYLKDFLPHRFPIIPGWDAAGTVAAVGAGVKGFAAGDEVFAYTRLSEVHSGTYAEFIAVPESFVARKPKTASLAASAALPLVGLTAYQALHEVLQIKAGENVLVTGGAGGVGSLAIQFAVAAGAKVTATAGSANQSYLKELGATHTIDYTQGNVTAAAQALVPQGFDAVFDAAGGASLKESATLVKDGGRLVSIVDTPTDALFGGKKVKHAYHFVYPSGAQLERIAALIDAGKVVVPTVGVRSVTAAAEAQTESQSRHVRGKLVLAIDFN